MMISPEGYYEECLKGKSEAEILQEISSLKEEISRLKQVLEQDKMDPELMIKPDPLTRIKCDRDFLKMAKKTLEEAGGRYEPTDEEQRDQSFNADLTSMRKFVLEINKFEGDFRTYTYTLSEDKKTFDVDYILFPKPSELPEVELFIKDEFLRGIAGLHIGEWKKRYENPYVLDGTQWIVSIEYEDGREPVQIHGSNAYPYNFRGLIEFLEIDGGEYP